MDGVHDMGGMHGFGKVTPEPNEPVFHAAWEGRCIALNRAMGYTGVWNIDMSRAAIEELPPDLYLTASYYKKWAIRLENMLLERGLIDADEIAAGHALRPGKPLKRTMTADKVEAAFNRGKYGRPASAPARFKPGDRVRAKNIHPRTHTRLPRYARGHVGMIDAVRGCNVFPDTVAIGQGENPQWLYTVLFDGRELWGENSDPTLTVSIDAWERISTRHDMSSVDPTAAQRAALASEASGQRGHSMVRVHSASEDARERADDTRPEPGSSARAIEAVPSIPRDAEGPVFREPWEAQAFAMALALHERGLFTWAEWAATLADEIKRAQAAGDPDTGETYYRHWLNALERIVAAKGIATGDMLHRYRDAWDHAADRTPHGTPIELRPEDFAD
jgi:nitrile hydratase beta subunit/nitrile hydratase accessory protein